MGERFGNAIKSRWRLPGKQRIDAQLSEKPMPLNSKFTLPLGLLFAFGLPANSFADSTMEGRDWKFATFMAKAVQHIEERYTTPVTRSELVALAVRGLYDEFKKPVSPAVEERLDALARGQAIDIRRLFRDAHASLFTEKANQEDGRRGAEICITAIFRRFEPDVDPMERSGFQRANNDCIYVTSSRVGVGLEVEADAGSGMIRVVTPIYKGPAYEAGIRSGDLITHIRVTTNANGEPLERPIEHSTKGMTAEQARKLLLGKSGTVVTVRVIRAG